MEPKTTKQSTGTKELARPTTAVGTKRSYTFANLEAQEPSSRKPREIFYEGAD